jgi:hypothetical protein
MNRRDPAQVAPEGRGPMRTRRRLLGALAALPLAGAARQTLADGPPLPAMPFRPPVVDPDLAARALALVPETITERDVHDTLAHLPAPRIVALQGSVPLVTMAPFAEFLVAMGYPADRVRHPADGSTSYSSYVAGERLAGALAWHYEREGAMPILIGHSQGGMAAVRALHVLAGTFAPEAWVWDPIENRAEARTRIVDPLDGRARPVVGLQVPYAAAIATGKVMRVLLGQWGMVGRVHEVPDSVDTFHGFFIDNDPLTGTFAGRIPGGGFRATGRARVENVLLPASYTHVGAPLVAHLAADARTRAWIDRYDPRGPLPPLPEGDTRNLLHAASIWAEVKRQWCLSAQKLVRRAHDAPPG